MTSHRAGSQLKRKNILIMVELLNLLISRDYSAVDMSFFSFFCYAITCWTTFVFMSMIKSHCLWLFVMLSCHVVMLSYDKCLCWSLVVSIKLGHHAFKSSSRTQWARTPGSPRFSWRSVARSRDQRSTWTHWTASMDWARGARASTTPGLAATIEDKLPAGACARSFTWKLSKQEDGHPTHKVPYKLLVHYHRQHC